MSTDKILVTALGGGLVIFIYWFFFGKRDRESEAVDGKIDILVDGGYRPSVIKLKRGVKSTLSILRKDPSPCLEEIVLPDFKIKKYLPVGKKVDIELTSTKAGSFPFHCGMNMYHGKIVVE